MDSKDSTPVVGAAFSLPPLLLISSAGQSEQTAEAKRRINPENMTLQEHFVCVFFSFHPPF